MSPAVAVAQFAPGPDQAHNLAEMRRLATTAVERGAGLVVFPEYSSHFDAGEKGSLVAFAEPLDGPFVAGLSSIAAELGIVAVAGMLETTEDPAKVANTLVAVSPQLERLAVYRKQHLYDAFGDTESDRILAGSIEPPQTFAWRGFTVGLQTCYDIRFPEVTRRLVDAGADLVLVPAEWVRGPLKEHHWRTLVTARAIENTIYVAAADHAPPIGAGNSMVVDPMGVELVTIGEAVDVAVAHITPARITDVRRVNPALALRRYRVEPR
jgi:deaminated glutathione amidase